MNAGHGAHARDDCRDIAMAAKLGDEASTGLECARNACQHIAGTRHPVQGRVGENRVELGI